MRAWLVCFVLLMTGCGQSDPAEQIQWLTGYWEIEKVKLADGSEKNFSINTKLDFIEVTGDSGIRKKVNPLLDGSFVVSKSAERFQLKIEGDSLRIYYTTPYDAWKETVVKAGDSILQLKNDKGNIYFYKKFQQLNLPK